MRTSFVTVATAAVAASQMVGAVDLNVKDASSIKSGAASIAKDLWSYYKGTTDASMVGLLDKPYYWWESGAMFGTMLSYSYMTGDKTYNGDVAKAIFSQVSSTKDFMMMNKAAELGNDDQAFWALTAMSAAEHKLPAPSGQPDDIWVTSASNAFNLLVSRWNTTFCGGGIKWQFIQANNGWRYKSSIANGATMQLGARLALLTGNQTYADKAGMIYDWMKTVGYISDSYQVFDGAGDDPDNCTKIDPHEWSYNSAALIGGSAALANFTASRNSPDAKKWADRTNGLWQHAVQNFFKNGVLFEQPCEEVGTCNVDQLSFKAYMARWATFAGQVFPSIQGDVMSKLQSTAAAAAKSCTGNNGAACGTQWWNSKYDGKTGVGQAMSGLEVISGLLSPNVPFVVGKPSDNSGPGSSGSSSSPSSSSAPSSASSSASGPSSTGAAAASSQAASSASSAAAAAGTPAPNTVAAAGSSAAAAATSAAAVASSLMAAASSAAANPTGAAAASSFLAAASSYAAVGSSAAAAASAAASAAPAVNAKLAASAAPSVVNLPGGLVGMVSVQAVTSCVPTTTYKTITVTETSTAKTTPVATTAPYATSSKTATGGVASGTGAIVKPTGPAIVTSNDAAGLSASFGGMALAAAAVVLFA